MRYQIEVLFAIGKSLLLVVLMAEERLFTDGTNEMLKILVRIKVFFIKPK